MTHTTVKSFEVLGRMSQVSSMDSPREQEPAEESFLELIRRVGDLATEQVRKEMQEQKATVSVPQETSSTTSHALQREMAAQSVLQRGLASSMEEARKMVDEAI
jgi:uracil phosphoribosyltransferase